jgi:hypothetical protein
MCLYSNALPFIWTENLPYLGGLSVISFARMPNALRQLATTTQAVVLALFELTSSGNFGRAVVPSTDSGKDTPMILGMSLETYTIVHVVISLIGIGSGLIVVFGMLNGKLLHSWNGLFLLTTVLTSVTGFGFPFDHLLPSHKVAIISLAVLAIAMVARYVKNLVGGWRRTYVITAMIALYLNVFVLVVQSFLKVPALHALAPEGKEPPFLVAQLVVMAIFIGLGVGAARKFRN